MTHYEVVFAKSAIKELSDCPGHVVKRTNAATGRLTENPRHRGTVKLSGSSDLYRLRIGNYRIIYDIDDDQRRVRVLAIRHRREAYR